MYVKTMPFYYNTLPKQENYDRKLSAFLLAESDTAPSPYALLEDERRIKSMENRKNNFTQAGKYCRFVVPRWEETMLRVEDADLFRKLAHRCLKRKGYALLVAADREEANPLAGKYKRDIHLVLTDIIMTRINSRQASKKTGNQQNHASGCNQSQDCSAYGIVALQTLSCLTAVHTLKPLHPFLGGKVALALLGQETGLNSYTVQLVDLRPHLICNLLF